jgi:putative transposase
VQGSHNRQKAHRQLARVHRRVVNVRQAFHWELAHELCAEYDIIRLETLNLQGMKARWGRKVSDLGPATFVDMLHHVAAQTGTVVQHIAPWFPSTTRCHVCGHVNAAITLRDRVWTCPLRLRRQRGASAPLLQCWTTPRRNVNAAININEAGASASGGDPVRLARASRGR